MWYLFVGRGGGRKEERICFKILFHLASQMEVVEKAVYGEKMR